jgi:hypothetical protein
VLALALLAVALVLLVRERRRPWRRPEQRVVAPPRWLGPAGVLLLLVLVPWLALGTALGAVLDRRPHLRAPLAVVVPVALAAIGVAIDVSLIGGWWPTLADALTAVAIGCTVAPVLLPAPRRVRS